MGYGSVVALDPRARLVLRSRGVVVLAVVVARGVFVVRGLFEHLRWRERGDDVAALGDELGVRVDEGLACGGLVGRTQVELDALLLGDAELELPARVRVRGPQAGLEDA